MKTVASLPEPIHAVENLWIPMRDGTRLAARAWLPESAEAKPAPAIVEYIPYRKRDVKRPRDTPIHAYFAAHGYCALRVDLRGSGDSQGVLVDEYLEQELQDGEDVLAWLAEQPWCDGKVGMIGISWGGFNGLQLAARRPPQLGAVIAVCATDDRYADDVHYMGGCLLNDNLSWASTMFAFNALPPDPAIVGESWREQWHGRLRGSGLWLETWMAHQHRDDYWRHGSVCEDYAAIACPVMAVSGWADGYSDPVFRLVQNLNVPRKGLIGPWSHVYPHMGTPGPEIGFLQECVRWWDQWLKGEETGVDDEPPLTVWMQHPVEPSTDYEHRPGRWVAETNWPSENVEERTWQLAPGRLLAAGEPQPEAASEPQHIQSPLSVGLFAGKWCSYGGAPDLPYDQREEDGGALVFDSRSLQEPIEIMGAPRLELEVEASQPVAMLAVRLSDVAPDGKATRVTYGLLNLCHRNGHDRPEVLEAGKRYRVSMELNHIAQAFRAGRRLRIAISTSYWPLAWVPPQPVRLTIHPERSRLILPVRRGPSPADDALPTFERSEGAPGPASVPVRPGRQNWLIERDLAREESTLHVINDDGARRIEDTGTVMQRRTEEWYRFRGDDVHSASGEVRSDWRLEREDWRVRIATRTVLTCDAQHFHIHATLDAYEADRRVFSETWNTKLPRAFL